MGVSPGKRETRRHPAFCENQVLPIGGKTQNKVAGLKLETAAGCYAGGRHAEIEAICLEPAYSARILILVFASSLSFRSVTLSSSSVFCKSLAALLSPMSSA